MLTHHEVIIEIHCIEYIPTCLALNRHLPNENVESKNITQPETHLYGVESGPGPGISFNDSGRLRIQFNLGCLNTFWFYLCIALTPGPGIYLNACGNLMIQFFGLICVILCFVLMTCTCVASLRHVSSEQISAFYICLCINHVFSGARDTRQGS